MGTTLTGTTPQDTYDSLIKVTDNGPISATAKFLSDGLGNDSVLALSTSAAGIGTSAPAALLSLSKSADASINVNTAATGTFPIKSGISFGAATTALGSDAKYTGGAGIQGLNIQQADNVTDLIFWTTAGGSPSEKVRITSAGNVGIGTSSPTNQGAGVTSVDITGSAGGSLTTKGAIVTGEFLALDAAAGLYISTKTNHSIILRTNDVERLRITNNGLTFNGDTAAANALDDYEEGTFTPTIAGSTTAGTATYSVQVGKYTKIGRQVSCQIDLGYNSGTGTGDLTITGLPFADATLANPAVTIGYLEAITLTASNYALAYIASSTTRIDFVQIPVGGGALTSVAYDAAGRIILNVTYTA